MPGEPEANEPGHWFATCQVGAERALKAEVARTWPAFRFAFSRPGFLTFKLPPDHGLPPDFDPYAVFARSSGFSLGKAAAPTHQDLAKTALDLAAGLPFEALHVFPRDTAAPGYFDFEPGLTAESQAAEQFLLDQWAARAGQQGTLARIAQPGQLVLDCILVEPSEWWIGFHRARGESCFPGGFRGLTLPPHAVSRAWLKMQEALAWSRLPIQEGDLAVELGCAPGGASQALLERGLHVTGVDPAEVDTRVLENPRFEHLRMRGADVRRRVFSGVRWLTADMNVAPRMMLDTVEAIASHAGVNIDGMLLTLKLLDWELAAEIPAYLSRIHSWGYPIVRARQLVHNRQEVCVAAMRRIR